MNPAAPFLLRYTPSSLPVRESVSTIVWVRRAGWHYWLRWQDWLHWWQDWLRDWSRWRRSGRAPTMVNSATPRFLVSCPGIFVTHSAVEWVHWPRRCRMRWWHCMRWCGRRSRWWCGRWCGRWCWERSGWNCHWWLWQSCGGARCGASPSHGAAAEVLLCLGPRRFPHRESSITIVRE